MNSLHMTVKLEVTLGDNPYRGEETSHYSGNKDSDLRKSVMI